MLDPLTVGRLLDVVARARSAMVHPLIGRNHDALVQDLADVAELCRAAIGASHLGTAIDAVLLEDPDAADATIGTYTTDLVGRLTLAEWEARYSGYQVRTHATGAKVLPDYLMPNGPRWDLFHLSDYVVSSVTGGSIWLIKRAETGGIDADAI